MDTGYPSSNTSTNTSWDGHRTGVSRAVMIPYLCILCVIMVTGTAGNILVIGAVLTNKQLRKIGNMLIVNLAVADLCVTTIVDPFGIIGVLEGASWFLDVPGACEVVASLCLTSCFCSLLSIGAISINRYTHICHDGRYNKIYTTRNTILICAGLWITSFLLDLPNFLGWGGHVFDRKSMTCVWDRTADLSYTLFIALVGMSCPVLVTASCYLKIWLFVIRQKTNIENSCLSKPKRTHMKLTRTLFVIFVTFLGCWFPYVTLVVVDVHDTFPLELHIFFALLAHVNSSLNWVIYGLQDQNFREGYKLFLRINRCKKNAHIRPGLESSRVKSITVTATEER